MTTAIKKIYDYFKENDDLFNKAITELDDYNGYLGDNKWYPMEYLCDFFNGLDSVDILNRAFFGQDMHSSTSFNPNRDYFSYNGYGNLVSSNHIDYLDYLDEYAITAMSKHLQWIDTINDNAELLEMFANLNDEFEKMEV